MCVYIQIKQNPPTLFHKYANTVFMKYIAKPLEVRCRDALQSEYFHKEAYHRKKQICR